MDMRTLKDLQVFLFALTHLLMLIPTFNYSFALDNNGGTCQDSEVLFILDGGAHIHFATTIVDYFKSHQTSNNKYEVRLGLVICEKDTIYYQPLQSWLDELYHEFRTIERVYEKIDRNLNSKDVAYQIKTDLGHILSLTATYGSCFTVAQTLFPNPVRAVKVNRMVMLITGAELENNKHRAQEAAALKDNNITMTTVAVGVRDMKTMKHLMHLASRDSTFFVVKNHHDLLQLAKELAGGHCQPITLQIDYPDSNAETTMTTLEPIFDDLKTIPCRRKKTGTRTYSNLIDIPGFGSIAEKEFSCLGTEIFSEEKCKCIV